MTIKELIAELNELITDGIVDENARVVDSELTDIFSIVESINNDNTVVIYF